MPPPRKPRLSDLDKEERITVDDAVGDTVDQGRRIAAMVRSGELTMADGVPVPPTAGFEDGLAATAWAEAELLKATPRAVQEVIHQMKKGGDAKQRLAAALQVLDRAGVQAKDNKQSNAPVIILTNKVVQNLPWVKEAKRQGQVVEGELVPGAMKEIASVKKDR